MTLIFSAAFAYLMFMFCGVSPLKYVQSLCACLQRKNADEPIQMEHMRGEEQGEGGQESSAASHVEADTHPVERSRREVSLICTKSEV